MAEPRDDDQGDEATGEQRRRLRSGRINDPLARTDVEAPQVPFQGSPPPTDD
jgi:hypothetical protein